MRCIAYKAGYKYQLRKDYELETGIRPPAAIRTEYVALSGEGRLWLKSGYAWDGPSGPTIDTLDFMRGSLVHDALYQLIRERHLDAAAYRDPADLLLQKLCLEDGMPRIRAWWVYHGVRLGGRPAADPASEKPLTWAPTKCE